MNILEKAIYRKLIEIQKQEIANKPRSAVYRIPDICASFRNLSIEKFENMLSDVIQLTVNKQVHFIGGNENIYKICIAIKDYGKLDAAIMLCELNN